jgi:hypothetical protein
MQVHGTIVAITYCSFATVNQTIGGYLTAQIPPVGGRTGTVPAVAKEVGRDKLAYRNEHLQAYLERSDQRAVYRRRRIAL